MIWNLAAYDKNTALIDGEEVYTYAKLREAGEALAAQFPSRSLVFLLCSNTPGAIAGYTGMVNAGHVPLLLDAAISRSLLEDLRSAYRPSYYLLPEKMEADFPDARCVYRYLGYSLLDLNETDPYPMHEDLCVLISTSGSTGSPKLVRQTKRNIVSNTESIIQYLGITESERAITSLPMNYVYGLSVINTHLYAGAALVLTDQNPYSKLFWNLVRDREVTSFAGVPFTYEMMDKLRIMKLELPSLKTMTQAGGKLLPALHLKYAQLAEERGFRFVVMYGASEATARMGYLPAERTVEKQGSMGIPIPGGRFELINENDQPIDEPNKTGELVYYGPNVTYGYATSGPDLARGDDNGGRLVTGDMAYFDEDGFYFIVGRKKRFLKMLGKRVNLDETERLLKNELSTVDIACAGKDDELRIFITDETLKDPAEEYVFRELGINRKLLRTYVIDVIPKNASGKVQYSVLNEW